MKKIILSLICITLLFSGCTGYTQEEVDSMVSEAVASATEKAYEEGYQTGKADGESESYDSAYSSGFEDGKEEGHLVTAAEYSKKILDLWKELEVPYPDTGTVFVSEYDCYAPLTVENPTNNAYYFKLFEYSEIDESQHDVLTFFVAPQSTADVLAPLGTYHLKCAYSTGAWYGTSLLFGEDTTAELYAETFEFTDDGYSYNGYSLSLQEVVGGNLNAMNIPLETF